MRNSAAPPTGALARLSVLFSSRDLRWLLSVSFLDAAGNLPRLLAQGWIVLEMTSSPAAVGLVAAAEGAAMLLLGGFGGVVAARIDRRWGIAIGQLGLALTAAATAALLARGALTIGLLMVLAAATGATRTIKMPSLLTLMGAVAGRSRMVASLAARNLALNLGKLVGSLIVGFLLERGSNVDVFVLLAAMPMVSAACLPFIRHGGRADAKHADKAAAETGARTRRHSRGRITELVTAAAFGMRTPRVRMLLMLSALMELVVFSLAATLPIVAREVLQVGAVELGWLSAATGIGAIVASTLLTAAGEWTRFGRPVVAVCSLAGLALFGLGASPVLAISLALATFLGVAMASYDALLFTLVQRVVPTALRERQMGLLMQTFGLNQLGALLTGLIAGAVGASTALIGGGTLLLLFVAVVVVPRRHLWDRLAATPTR